jgi:hypothetical protein
MSSKDRIKLDGLHLRVNIFLYFYQNSAHNNLGVILICEAFIKSTPAVKPIARAGQNIK